MGALGIAMTSVMTLYEILSAPGFFGFGVTALTCSVGRTSRPSLNVISVTQWRMPATFGPDRAPSLNENGWVYPKFIMHRAFISADRKSRNNPAAGNWFPVVRAGAVIGCGAIDRAASATQ